VAPNLTYLDGNHLGKLDDTALTLWEMACSTWFDFLEYC